MKVLLVDDSKTMRNIQKGILSQLGYIDLEEACDGLDAMSKVRAFEPELMLVDWNMPNMDGLTFVKKVRASGNTCPIIMVTTEAERTRVVEAIKAGVNNYVVKPFTPDVLQDRIKETLARTAAA
jgi:two-component system, chemotaxis family, chemotaxis protein CheY